MNRWFVGTALGIAAVSAVVAPAGAHLRLESQGTRPPVVQVIDTGTKVDANQVSMFVTNLGSFAFDLQAGNSGLEFPKGTGKTAVFAAGLWMGARVAGETRVTVAEYSQEFGPGPMNGTVPAPPGDPNYRVYKVSREDTTGWADWIANAVPLGAPVDTTGGTTKPGITGDQTLWAVFNDADQARHINDAGNSTALGVEVQLTAFEFNRQGALGNTVFLSYIIINKGTSILDSTYVSIWSDPDLGGAGDDLVGVDTSLSLGYVYNATNNDNVYGNAPPAVGFDFFRGPVVAGEILGLKSFNKYINGTDPNSRDQSYNYMKGLNADGTPVIDPTTGQPTPFTHPGDPVRGTGWLDTNPADRRLMNSSGPFTMAPGDTQRVVCAVIVGQGRDRLSSIKALRFYDQSAQDAFNRNFDLPDPPNKPTLSYSNQSNKVVLTWDAVAEVNDPTSTYQFEGYNIYQGETVAGPWHRVATYDLANGIATISDAIFDPSLGDIIVAPVQFGEDSGLRYNVTLTTDIIKGGKLNNGTQYYYSVTAYNYDPNGTPVTLENAQGTAGQDINAIIAMPQGPTAGTDLTRATAPVVQGRYDTNIPPSTDVVTAEILDPSALTGCLYEVYYTDLVPPAPPYNGVDSVYVAWNLRKICGAAPGDTTVLLTDQVNKTGDTNYTPIDGMLIKVTGSYVIGLQSATYQAVDEDSPEFEGVDFELGFFGGGAGPANSFFFSTLDPAANPDSFTTVELRFDSTATQKAYVYFRDQLADGSAPSDGRGYHYGGFFDCRFQAWDTVNDRQLDAVFVEKRETDDAHNPTSNILPSNDHTWGPTADALGDREYLGIATTLYTDTPKPLYEVDDALGLVGEVPQLPLLYALIVTAPDPENPYPDNGESFRWLWASPGRPNDVYRIQTTAALRDDPALASSQMSRIRVVPNPYYTRSAYEQNQFARQIRFMNLPATCTIRIFNLSGDLVRTLQKSDASTSVLTWDALTNNQLPVGSGVYIYQVEAPGVGQTSGRMIVFMEKERLNNF